MEEFGSADKCDADFELWQLAMAMAVLRSSGVEEFGSADKCDADFELWQLAMAL